MIDFLKLEIIYKNSLVRFNCPKCGKLHLIENKDGVLNCEKCLTKIKHYETIEYIFEKKARQDFENMVLNCNDEIKLNRSLKLVNKLNSMNNKEYNDYLGK